MMLASLLLAPTQVDQATGKITFNSFYNMAQSLWTQETPPVAINPDKSEFKEWREVKNILPVCEQETSVYLTAKMEMECNQDLGFYPKTLSDINDENKWMTYIRFTNSDPFNLLVSESPDGEERVKVVDYISKGEHLRVKYESEKAPVNLNWNCLVHRVQALDLQSCSGFNCTCYEHEYSNNENYFYLKTDANPESKPSTTNLNLLENQLKLNFHRAEKIKNKIFRRTSLNAFTSNLRHKLFDKIGQGRFTPDSNRTSYVTPKTSSFQRRTLTLKRRHCFGPSTSQSDLSDYPSTITSTNSDCDDKFRLHCELGLTSCGEDDDSRKSNSPTNISFENNNYKCNFCGDLFNSPRTLRYHSRHHTNEVSKSPRRRPPTRSSPRSSTTVHHGFQCEECEKIVKTSKGLKIHKMYVHTDRFKHGNTQQGFKCEECEKIMKTSKGLKIHKTYIHTDRFKNEAGKNCENILSSKSTPESSACAIFGGDVKVEEEVDVCENVDVKNFLDVKVVVEKLRLLSCSLCDKMFTRVDLLDDHEKNCGKSVVKSCQRVTRQLRKELDCEGRYKCEDCGEKFAFRQSLRFHTKQHEEERRLARLEEELASSESCSEDKVELMSLIDEKLPVCHNIDVVLREENVESLGMIIEDATSSSCVIQENVVLLPCVKTEEENSENEILPCFEINDYVLLIPDESLAKNTNSSPIKIEEIEKNQENEISSLGVNDVIEENVNSSVIVDAVEIEIETPPSSSCNEQETSFSVDSGHEKITLVLTDTGTMSVPNFDVVEDETLLNVSAAITNEEDLITQIGNYHSYAVCN